MQIAEMIIFWLMAMSVIYLFVFTLASKFYSKQERQQINKLNKFAVLFPAYREDKVIIQSIYSFLKQDYPSDKYEIIVISDQMKDSTNEELSLFPIRLLIADYKESSKAKAMKLAIEATLHEQYDMIIIMDADNITTPDFLHEINQARNKGLKAIQAHRVAKNSDTNIAILDAISEEINNSIFRKGHVTLGFSSALIGSGMALDATWFRNNVKLLQTTGEDKELEILLLKDNIYIEYLNHLLVFDEKIQKKESLKNQRQRWVTAQFESLTSALPYFPKALFTGNFDYCDKIIQWMLPPRIVLVFILFVFGCLTSFIRLEASFKWWMLFAALIFTLILAIPRQHFNKKTLKAITQIPSLTFIMLSNIMKSKTVDKKFIHTDHGN
ncbi:glycosyltransferase family 2 protein [uncultured Bacteroides sp.]|uniref:glycosyltransferase n=1 Tax=uncultured Bacteroides sp. TaxID=162156 RepID=UPI002AAA9388|nr:glycosyltransferase family 2 protein [uncultured Bacteroides sp.]